MKPTKNTSIILIKTAHTVIWMVMVLAIIFTLYAGITNTIDNYLIVAVSLIIIEITALAGNKWVCPLTSLYLKYNDNWETGDDIYLPKFVAKYNREIFTPPLLIGLILVIARLLFQ